MNSFTQKFRSAALISCLCLAGMHGFAKEKMGTTAISAGEFHALALRSDGTVWAWGTNRFGEMGLSNATLVVSPNRLLGLSNIVGMAAGPQHSLAVANNGQVWAWGTNSDGRLGNGTYQSASTLVVVSVLTNAVKVAAGVNHSLAVLADGRVFAWGTNNSGQLGTGNTQATNQPVQVTNLTNVVNVAGGLNHTLALTKAGEVWSWGSNGNGQLGFSGSSTQVPVRIPNLSNIVQIAAGDNHGLALDKDGRVFAWGYNGNGQLGIGTTTFSTTPLLVTNLPSVRWIAASYYHSAGVTTNGSLFIWGGTPYSGNLTRPSLLGAGQRFRSVAEGHNFLLATKEDGSVWAWGKNDVGQWGCGDLPWPSHFTYEDANPAFSFSPYPYAQAGRFNRGDRNKRTYNSFVLALDLENGVKLDAQGQDLYCYGLEKPWFLRVTNTPCSHAFQLVSGTTNVTRFAVENPVAAFGSSSGGSPLYTGQGYTFGLYAGAFDENSGKTNIVRISAYPRAVFNGGATNIVPTNVFEIALPRRSVAVESNAWQNFVTNGFVVVLETNGLRTTVEFVDGAANDKPWGLSWLFSGGQSSATNVVLAGYRLTHTATSTNFCYKVEVLGSVQVAANVMAPLATNSTGQVPVPMYAMDFEDLPAWRSSFIDQPHFAGIPTPSTYAGRTAEELNGMTAQPTNMISLSSLTNFAAFTNLDNSPEFLQHPVLNQFVEDMGRDPLALANYVINEIELVDPIGKADSTKVVHDSINLGGLNRAALGTFLEGQGSPTEQCALLIYLLRRAGYSAGYVWPTNSNLRMLDTRVSKLWQIQVKGVVSYDGTPVITNSLVVANYPWVVANIGTNCVHIFPWLKDTEIVEGGNLNDYLPSNYGTAYAWLKDYALGKLEILNLAPESNLPMVLWPRYIQSVLLTNRLDSRMSLDDIGVRVFNRRNHYPTWQHLPMPNFLTNQAQVAVVPTLSEDLATFPFLTNAFDQIRVEVYKSAVTPANLLLTTTNWYACNWHNRKLLLFANSATNLTLWLAPWCPGVTNQGDFTGGPFSTNIQMAQATVATNITQLKVRIAHKRKRATLTNLQYYFPDYDSPGSTNDVSCQRGDVAAICMSFGRVTPAMLRQHADEYWRIERERALNATNSPAIVDNQGTAAVMLGMGYFQKLSRFDSINQRLYKIRGLTTFAGGLGIVGAVPKPTNMQAKVDMQYISETLVGNASLRPDSGEVSYVAAENYYHHLIVNGSAQEHEIINTTFGDQDAISTVRLLQLAAQHARSNGWAAPLELNSRNYLALGNQTNNGYGNTLLKNQDSGIWSSVVLAFSGWDADYARVLITPGLVTNNSGTYVGMGALILNKASFGALITANRAVLNGGWGSQLPTFTPPATPTYELSYNLFANNDGSFSFGLNNFSTPTVQSVLSPLDASILNAAGGSVGQIVWTPSQASQGAQIANAFNFSGNNNQVMVQGVNYGVFIDERSYAGTRSLFGTIADPVEVVSGCFYVDTVDLALPGPMPLQVRRNYLSRNQTGNQFGYGWKINFMPWLLLSTNAAGTRFIHAAEMDGAVIAYRWQTNNLWVVTPEDNPTLNNNTTVGAGGTANMFNSRIESFATNGTWYVVNMPDGGKRYYKVMDSFGIVNGTNHLDRVRPYLTRWEDHAGNYHSFRYGTNAMANDYGQLNRIESANGNFLGFQYDFFGRIIEAFAWDGRRVRYSYDDYGDLVQVQLPDASEWNYEYQHYTFPTNSLTYTDSYHLMVKEIKPDGRLLVNAYDAYRRVITQAATVGTNLALMTNAWFFYTNNCSGLTNDFLSGYTRVEDVFRNPTVYYYTNNLITKIIAPCGRTNIQDWFETGETNKAGYYARSLEMTIDPRNLTNTFHYDTNGNVASLVTHGDLTGSGDTTETATNSYTYNTNFLPATTVDPAGTRTDLFYEDSNDPYRLTKMVRSNAGVGIATNRFSYTNVSQTVDMGGWSKTLNSYGLRVLEVRADTATNAWAYDGRGFVTQSIQFARTGEDTSNNDPAVTNYFAYNARGELYEKWNGAGRTLIDYDNMGRVKWREVLDENGVSLSRETFYYNRNGELEWYDGPQSDPEDFVWFDYDGAGRKIQEIHWRSRAKADGAGVEAEEGDARYATTFYNYDAFGNLLKTTNPRGVVATNGYDALGRVIQKQVMESDGAVLAWESFGYDSGGSVLFHTNALGGITKKQYTTTGKLKWQENPDGSTNAWRYYLDGRMKQEFLANGNYWETAYDDANRRVTRSFKSGGDTLATAVSDFDRLGNLVQKTDEAGNIFNNVFDGLDRIKFAYGASVTNVNLNQDFSFTTNVSRHIAAYLYDASGKVLTVTNALGEKTITTSDALGRPVAMEIRDAQNNQVRVSSTSYGADHHSLMVVQGSGANAIVSTTYTDSDGHPVLQLAYPSLGVTEYTLSRYDTVGNLIYAGRYSSDGLFSTLWSVSTMTYDGLNRVKTQTVQDAMTSFGYDLVGNLTNRAMPGGLSWNATYNVAGQVTKDWNVGTGNASTRTNTYSYYSASSSYPGQLHSRMDSRGVTSTLTYDPWLRPATNTFSGSADAHNLTTVWQYDVRGLATNVNEQFNSSATGPSTTIKREYDEYGQLQSEKVMMGTNTISYAPQSWDAAGRRTQLSLGGGYRFGWRADGLLSAVAGPPGTGSYSYENSGLLLTRTVGTKTVSITQHDGMGRPVGISTEVNSQSVLSQSLAYTGDGLVATHTLTRTGDFTDNRSYTYADSSRRLIEERLNLDTTKRWTNSFVFDRGQTGGPGILTKAGQTSDSALWDGGADAFSRVHQETNTAVHRLAYGQVNGPASVTATLDSVPWSVSFAGTNAVQWRTILELTPGPHRLELTAQHPSGLFVTNAVSLFTNNAAYEHISNTYDGSGFLTQRIWFKPNGQTNRTQSLVWDGKGRLFQVIERDSTNSGKDLYVSYDALGRMLRTKEILTTNSLTLTNQAFVVDHYYDPLNEFLELGLKEDGTYSWKLLGPNAGGVYGAQNGTGGLEATVTGIDPPRLTLADASGNLLGECGAGGGVTWFASRTTSYGAVPGYRPLSLAHGGSLSSKYAWRNRAAVSIGYVWLGGNWYDPESGRFLAPDPLGHAGSISLYSFCNGDPVNYWDPDGRIGTQVAGSGNRQLASFEDSMLNGIIGIIQMPLNGVGTLMDMPELINQANWLETLKSPMQQARIYAPGSTDAQIGSGAAIVVGTYMGARSVPVLTELGANAWQSLRAGANAAETTPNIVYRALTQADADALAAGRGLTAKAPNGTWTAAEHVANAGPGTGGASFNSPWISTSARLDVAQAYDSGHGVIAIDLNQVPSFQVQVWRTAPRVNGVQGLPFQRSFWAEETTVYQQIPFDAILGPKK